MGSTAIEPLVGLLKELISNPSEKIAESEGVSYSNQNLDPHTRSTSKNAIYEVLGQLHAAEAIPLLVTIMEDEEIDDMIQCGI